MAQIPNHDDPSPPASSRSAKEKRRGQIEGEFQPDPMMTEGQASRTRVGIYVIVILAVLAALFYSLNTVNNSRRTASNAPASTGQNTPKQPPAAATIGQAQSAPAQSR